jgi:hypothetical protein
MQVTVTNIPLVTATRRPSEDPRDGGAGGHFLRFDRAELVGSVLVIRAVPPAERMHRRLAASSPLAYLYERVLDSEPTADLRLAAGHYDERNLVWCFSGDITGIVGLTEPLAHQ